jgi:hypothetical protein
MSLQLFQTLYGRVAGSAELIAELVPMIQGQESPTT